MVCVRREGFDVPKIARHPKKDTPFPRGSQKEAMLVCSRRSSSSASAPIELTEKEKPCQIDACRQHLHPVESENGELWT